MRKPRRLPKASYEVKEVTVSEVRFEDALKRLQEIVEDLEKGDILLDESLRKYEEGVNLAAVCQRKLEQAKEKIEILVKTKSGKIRLEPFTK